MRLIAGHRLLLSLRDLQWCPASLTPGSVPRSCQTAEPSGAGMLVGPVLSRWRPPSASLGCLYGYHVHFNEHYSSNGGGASSAPRNARCGEKKRSSSTGKGMTRVLLIFSRPDSGWSRSFWTMTDRGEVWATRNTRKFVKTGSGVSCGRVHASALIRRRAGAARTAGCRRASCRRPRRVSRAPSRSGATGTESRTGSRSPRWRGCLRCPWTR